jgi:hypothetical protein
MLIYILMAHYYQTYLPNNEENFEFTSNKEVEYISHECVISIKDSDKKYYLKYKYLHQNGDNTVSKRVFDIYYHDNITNKKIYVKKNLTLSNIIKIIKRNDIDNDTKHII